MNNFEDKAILREILPKTGLVYSERGGLTETLCKPKMMPLKSLVLEQLQKIESSVNDKTNEKSKAEN
jgi:BBSome-interacting protein 1